MYEPRPADPSPHPHLRLVASEDPPAYDAGTPRLIPDRRHMTVIEDEAVEAIAGLGMAALGLYTYLERLVDKSGEWRVSIPDLAAAFSQSERYVQEAMTKLIAAGWVERVERSNRYGMQMANIWRLPQHAKPRTYGGEPTGEPTGEPRTASEFTPINVDTLRTTVEEIPPLPPKGGGQVGGYTSEFETWFQGYPKGRGSKAEAFKVWKRLGGEQRAAALAALPAFRAGSDWQRGYHPAPEVWLRGRRWENPPEPMAPPPRANGKPGLPPIQRGTEIPADGGLAELRALQARGWAKTE